MMLDKEDDRSLLLELISKAQISGASVFVIADLVTRIKGASIDPAPKQTSKSEKMS